MVNDDRSYDKNNFPVVLSRPNWFWTWVIRLLLFGLYGFGILSIFFIPAAFAMDGYYGDDMVINAVVLTVAYAVLLWSFWRFIGYLKSVKKNARVSIRVDGTGVHYTYLDGSSESILYVNLQKSNRPYIEDVFVEKLYKGGFLFKVFREGRASILYFMTDIGYGYYTGNEKQLLGNFIRGVRLFRPDLTISPVVYPSFYIHPETCEFDPKELKKTWITLVLVFVIVFLGIELFMIYRFGGGLVFDLK